MKGNKALIAGALCALGCAACAAAFVIQVNAQAEGVRAEALAKYGGEQVEVCVATRDLSAGEMIDASSVELRMWIADLLPEDAVTSRDEVMGKTLGSSVMKGEVFSMKRFVRLASELEVPVGYSAVSVPVQEVQAVGGALVEGMRIDVYATGSSGTTLILSDALILATGFSEESSLVSSGNGGMTLAVPPESVQELVSAAQTLELYFVLPGEPVEPAASEADSGLDASDLSAQDASAVQGEANDASVEATASTEDVEGGKAAESAEAGKATATNKSAEAGKAARSDESTAKPDVAGSGDAR